MNRLRHVFAVLFCLGLFISQSVMAQAAWGGLSIAPANGTVDASTGKLNVAVNGSVQAADGGAVNSVVLYYDNREVQRQNFGLVMGPDGETPVNTRRDYVFSLPVDPGSHTVQLGASTTNGAMGYTAVYTVNAAAIVKTNGAAFVTQVVPSTMTAGQSYSVSVTMRNTGTKTWVPGGAQPHGLGALNPMDNYTWRPQNRVPLTASVEPGASYTFNFTVTAPSTAGTYNFQWGMVQDYVAWFGSASDNVPVTVSVPQPSASFSSPDEGKIFIATGTTASVTFAGTTASVTFAGTAAPGSGAALSSVQLLENGTAFTPASSSASITGSKSLAPGSHTIELRVTDSRNQVARVYRTVNVKPSQPTAEIARPTNGQVIQTSTSSASVPITATGTPAAGASISQMRLYIDNVLVAGATTAGSSLSTTQTLSAGVHTIGVEATDNYGSVSTRSGISVTIQAPAPTADISAPRNNSVYLASGSTAAVTVTGSATAVGGIAVTRLELLDNGSVIDPGTDGTSFNKSVNLAPGQHTLVLRASNSANISGTSAPVVVNVVSQVAGDSATQASVISVPSTMRAGQPYMVTVSMLNNGTTTWTDAANYRLGAQNPQDDRTWGGRAYLANSVAPGQVASFTFPVTAPAQAGTYNFQWKMVQERVKWFGSLTANVVVTVATGAGPTATLSASPSNVRVSGTQTKSISLTGAGSRSGGAVTKLELFQNSGRGYGLTPVLSTTGNAATLNFANALTLPAGAYAFRLRATDSDGVATDSDQTLVNITNSGLLGTVSGVRSNAAGAAELFGWVCQAGNTAALTYQILLDAPTFESGGVLLTQGTANVASEADNASVAGQCGSGGHHFVVDLSGYTSTYAGRSLYVYAGNADASATVTLPCADNSCTMPGSLRVGLASPTANASFTLPQPAFLKLKLANYTGSFDEVGFVVNGEYIAAGPDGAAGEYSVQKNGLAASSTPYTVYARVRQGNTSLRSIEVPFYINAATAVSVTSPSANAGLTVGAPVPLAASATGSNISAVRFYANGTQIAVASNSGSSWNGIWTPVTAGTLSIEARAFDANGAQVAASATVPVTVAAAANSGDPIAVTPPYLGNQDAGTLPGELGVDANGAATYSIPLSVPPGTAGLAPNLSLNYSSSGNNSHVGVGWNLGGLSSIHRCGKTIAQDGINARINFDKGDRLCLDGARLVLTSAKLTDDTYWADDAVYRTEIDSFVRVKAQGAGSARTFVAEYKDGRVATFGNPDKAVNARVAGYVTFADGVKLTNAVTRADAQSWALDKIVDRSGNFITFYYTQNSSTGEHLIDAIRYGGNRMKPHAMVQFSYEGRTDGWTRYIDGTRNDLRQRIAHIKTYVGNDMSGSPANSAIVRDYALNYGTSPSSGRSLLKSVAASAANPDTGTMEPLPATTFEWGAPDPGKTADFVSRGMWTGAPILTTHAKSEWRSANHPDYFAFQDFENHGYTDVLEKRVANPYPLPGTEENLDLAANPIAPGTTRAFYRYLHNNGKGFDAYEYELNTKEKFVVLELGDFDGDGAPDLLVVTDQNVAKICLSPLAKGLTTASNGRISFNCASAVERPAMGANTVDGMPYLVDVVGDGRSAMYGDLDPRNHTAPLYIQNEKLIDTEPSYSVLPYSREDQRNYIADTVQRFISFDQMVDFAGIGKHADVRWTLPYVRPFTIGDNGEPIGSTGWVNLEPGIEITDFRRPGTPRLGKMRGYAMHAEYPAPDCVQQSWPDGSSRYACDPAPYRFDAPSGGAVADFNGSGYSNLLFGFVEINKFNEAPRADATLCLSTGRELDCGALSEHSGASYKVAQAVGNFVGDGAPAVLMRETRRGKDTSGRDMVPVPVGGLQMCRLTGMGETSAEVRTSCSAWPGLYIPGPSSDASDQVFYMDLLGTGRTQAVYYHAGKFVANVWQEDGRWEVFEPADIAVDGQALDRIHKVTNGLGAVSGVEYRDGLVSGVVSRAGNSDLTSTYPQHVALSPGKVVSRLKQANGVAAQHATSYRYFDPATDLAGRGALGFAAVESRDEQSGIVTTTQYSHVWPKNGQVRTVTVASGSVVLARTTNTPAYKQFTHASGESTYQPYIDTSEVVRQDLDGSSLGKVTTKSTYDDSYGNLKNQRVTSTIDGTTLFVTEMATEFQNDDAKWLIGLPTSVTTTRTDPVSGALARKVAYEYDSTTGLRTRETVQPTETLYQVVTDYLRPLNKFGVVEETRQTWTDPLSKSLRSRSVKTAYDDNGRYVVSSSNAEGHTESYKYVAGTGARSVRTDANNQITQWTTDGFGRVRKESRSDGNETRVYQKSCLANACPGMSGAAAVQITEQFHGASRIAVPALVYSDSVGHVLRTQTYAFNGDATYVDRSYDSLGRVIQTSQPAYLTNTSPVMASRQEYDALNRVTVSATLGEGGKELLALTEYKGLTTKLTNPKLQVRTDVRNVIGQVVKVTDALQGVTEFVYDPFGNLSQTTDPGKSIIKIEYDKLGRKTALVDPDLGRIEYTVDPVGRVRAQSSKLQRDKKQSTETDYDLLDRMTSRVQSDLKALWKYDTALNGKGQLAQASTETPIKVDYLRVHTYDSYGRPDTTTQTLTSGTYTSQVAYDGWGRAITQKYNGAGTAKQFDLRYNKNGFLSAVERNGLKLWSVSKQDAANRATEVALGNGLTQVLGYDPSSARLTSDQVKTAASALRLDQSYGYDGLGSVIMRTQYWDTNGFIETFTYDGLNRLETSAIGTTTQTFKYNANGSLRSKSGVGSGDYVYPQALEQRPHAVSSIPGYASFTYDDNGNLTSAGGESVDWTSFDMPKLIKKNGYSSSFVYGPEYQRVRQDRGDGMSIVYADAQEIELQNSTVSKVRTYWPMGIGFEVDSGNNPSQLVWTHKDRLGSPVALTGDNGTIIERLAYDAWGKRRSAVDNTTPDTIDGVTDRRGFTGHEMLDQLDLVHMNGRVYDPFTAKFLSGDPLIQDPMNGQSYNRYSYVLNNPTNLTDPTGFCATGTEQTGTKICAKDSTVEVSDGEGGTKLVFTKVWNAMLKAVKQGSGLKMPDGTVLTDAKNSGENKKVASANTPGQTLREYSNRFRSMSQTSDSELYWFQRWGPLDPRPGWSEQANRLELQARAMEGDKAAIAMLAGEVLAPIVTLGAAGVVNSPCKCFVAGTLVHTSTGLVKIEDVKVGDLVAARDEFTNEFGWKPVLATIRDGEKEVLRVTYVNGDGVEESLGVTPEHPFMLDGHHWSLAGELQPNDKIMRLDGKLLTIKSIHRNLSKQQTYNFEVSDFHTYFVGNMGAWVHNAPCVIIDRSRYPESAKHIEDAQAAGKPATLTIDRSGANDRRSEALNKIPTQSGKDRDEYPPAMFKEGGNGASVRHINPSDNRGAGSCIGAQCRGLPNGTQVTIEVK